jgi:hypothetical protein
MNIHISYFDSMLSLHIIFLIYENVESILPKCTILTHLHKLLFPGEK